MRRRLCLLLASTAPAILAVAILDGSTPDEEEFRFAILASVLHVRTLAQSSWAWWTSSLGLGIPLPLVPNFHIHPLVALLTVLPPVTWVRLLYLIHTLLGAVGMWRLAGAIGLGQLVKATCVFSFLLATPAQNYLLTDFWPSHYLVWTSAPWLLLFAWRFLAATGQDVVREALLLGIGVGLVLANTNPGHAVVYGTVALAVVAARWRAVAARPRGALLAAVLAIAISSPNHVQLTLERAVFDEALDITKVRDPLPASAAWDVFLRPLSRSGAPWQSDVSDRGTRLLFFGGPFAVLALAGMWVGRGHRDLVLGMIVTAALLFTPFLPITFASRFHFRDPLTLCAIPLAGVALDALLRSQRLRLVGAGLVALQIAIMSLAVWPFLATTLEPDARQAWWFRGATADTPMADALIALMPRRGRLAYSPQIDAEISAEARLGDGLGINSLAYRGVAVINGSFKGVSTDVLWPDDRLFYGRIRMPIGLMQSAAGLDVLGIRYVLANPGEPVAPGLSERGRITKQDHTQLVLYENRDVWPGAFVIRGKAPGQAELPRYARCSHDRLLCKDLTAFAQRHDPVVREVIRAGDRIDITLDSSDQRGLLILAEMFRPAWTAAAADATLTTMSVGPGLLGVTLPPGTTSVQMEYRPLMLRVSNAIAWTALAGGLLGWFTVSRRGRRGGPATR